MAIIKETTFFGKWSFVSEVKSGSKYTLDKKNSNAPIRRFEAGNRDIGFVDYKTKGDFIKVFIHGDTISKDNINKEKMRKTKLGGMVKTVFRWEP